MTHFAGLLDARIAVAEAALPDPAAFVLPEEAAFVANAVRRRRDEFAAGRSCARRAMAALGVKAQPVLVGPDRCPIWPPGLAGSIAHSDDHCVAAVALRSQGFRSIGVDIEPALALPDDLWEAICLPSELDWLATLDAREGGRWARAIFSAKEAAFKCLYGVTGQNLEFHDLRVAIDPAREQFTADVLKTSPESDRLGVLHGRVRVAASHIATATAIVATS
ncbi:MAG: 4'-phosphopantetheinyl transferase family protein [Hyphomicrobium sp.]